MASSQAAIVEELYKRRETLAPDQRAVVDELSKRFNVGSAADEGNRALAGTGLSVSQPKAPIPAELGPDQDISPWKDPTQGLIGQGVRQMGRGVAGLSRPGLDPKLEAASEIVGGAGKVGVPFAIGAAMPALAANPVGTVAGLVGGGALATGLGKGGKAAAHALGAGPGLEALTEQAGEGVGGVAGFKGGAKFPPGLSAFRADPRVAINRSLRPTPSDPRFPQRIPRTLAAIKEANPEFKPAVENGELNVAPAATRAIESTQAALEPWLERAKGTTVSGDPIVKATIEATRGMLPSESPAAQALIERAQRDYGHEFTPQQLRDRLKLLNERYDAFASQAPGKQSAALADIPDAVLKAQRDAAANTLYRHLDPEGGGESIRPIQNLTGDLMSVRDASLRRNNAIVAEQPLTPFGKFADPIKGAIRHMIPWRSPAAGLAFAEGSEGRSLPMMRRAFKAVGDEPANVLPKPEHPLYPRVRADRQLPAGPAVQMPGGGSPSIPDTSGDRSWTGPRGAPPPFRQLESGPTPEPQRVHPSGGTIVTPTGDQSRVSGVPARKVIDPETGKTYYISQEELDLMRRPQLGHPAQNSQQ